ncbi:MAG TPA: ABC transporter substrate-binding protein [Mycobacteriales bacterium]|nr:ABC transporter substrate-binding protein [Mycobacteriales bacterium]
MPRLGRSSRKLPLRAASAACAVALVLTAAACSSGSSGGSGTAATTGAASTTSAAPVAGGSSGTLHLAFLSDMSTPDPDVFYDIEGNTVILSTYEGLVQYKPGTTQIEPDLAQSFSVSKDGLTYTFHLRHGVLFHDGTPFDAAAAKASFERRLEVNSAPAYMLKPVAQMLTPNKYTFVVKLKQVVTPFLDYLASSWGPKMLSPTALKLHAGKDFGQTYLNTHDIGTGPYELTAFVRGSHYTLTRFAKYWGPAPAYQTVDIAITPDMNSQILALKAGDQDAILHSFPTPELASIQSDPDLVVDNFDSYLTALLYMNVSSGPLTSLPLRKEIAEAIDVPDLVKEVYGDYGSVAQSMYPKGILPPGEAPISYPPKAVKVNGIKLSFAYTADDSGLQQRLAELIQQKLEAAGFSVSVREVQNAQTYGYPTDVKSAPDLLLETNTPDAAHPDTWGRIVWGTGGGLNFFDYSNPKVDALMDKGRQTTNKAASDQDYVKAGEMMAADYPILFLASSQNVMVWRKSVTGVTFRPEEPWTVPVQSLAGTG